MSLESIPNDTIKYNLILNLDENDVKNFTSINKAMQKLGRSALIWKEKVDDQIQNGEGFRLEGFDHKTMYLINATRVDEMKTIKAAKSITLISLGTLCNLYIFNETVNAAISSSYCDDQPLLIFVPCYLTSVSITYWYNALKLLPVILPLTLSQDKVARLFNKQVRNYGVKFVKVTTYLKGVPEVPDRTLPFYASCFKKAVQCWEKTKSAFNRATNASENILQRYVLTHLQLDLQLD